MRSALTTKSIIGEGTMSCEAKAQSGLEGEPSKTRSSSIESSHQREKVETLLDIQVVCTGTNEMNRLKKLPYSIQVYIIVHRLWSRPYGCGVQVNKRCHGTCGTRSNKETS